MNRMLQEYRNVLALIRTGRHDFGISEESVLEEIKTLNKKGQITDKEFMQFVDYFKPNELPEQPLPNKPRRIKTRKKEST